MNEYENLDLTLNFLNEGKITEAIHNKIGEKKIKAWIESAETFLKTNGDRIKSKIPGMEYQGLWISNAESLISQYHAIRTKYGQTKSFKSNKNRMEKLYNNIIALKKDLEREAIISCLKNFKEKEWDKYKISSTWEGDFLASCCDAGIKPQDVIKHYSKSTEMQSYKYFIEMWYCDNIKELEENDPAIQKCDLDDKCLEFYSNDDNSIFYNYSKNLLIELTTEPSFEIIPVSELYKVSGVYEYCDDNSKLMKEEGITFKV